MERRVATCEPGQPPLLESGASLDYHIDVEVMHLK